HLTVRNVDQPDQAYAWNWPEAAPAPAANRFGFASWGEQDAHFTSASVAALEAQAVPSSLAITSDARAGDNLEIQIANPNNITFVVEASSTLEPGSWTTVAAGESGATWNTPITSEDMFFRLRAR